MFEVVHIVCAAKKATVFLCLGAESVGGAPRHTVVVVFMPRWAEPRRHTVVVVCVCL